jgi:hypothetical protein
MKIYGRLTVVDLFEILTDIAVDIVNKQSLSRGRGHSA